MRKVSILLWITVHCLLTYSSQATITNTTQGTGPFADIDTAMAGANRGDSFSVTGTVGGGTIDVPDVTFTGTTGAGTDIVNTPVVVDADRVTLSGLTFISGSSFLVDEGASLTAIDSEFIGAATDGVLVGPADGGQGSASFKADNCTFSGNGGIGVHIARPVSSAVLLNSTVTSNLDDGVSVGVNTISDGSRLTLENTKVLNNGSEGVKVAANNAIVEIVGCLLEGSGAENVEFDNGFTGCVCRVFDTETKGAGRAGLRFKQDVTAVIDNTEIHSNSKRGIRISDFPMNDITVLNSCIHNNGNTAIELSGDPDAGTNTIVLKNCTLFNNSGNGIDNQMSAFPGGNAGNSFDIQYTIIAEWSGTGFVDAVGDATVVENNNLYAHSNPAASPRSGITAGANTVDDLQANALTDNFCSTVIGNADFLKSPVATSKAVNIDGIGGLAGAKTLCNNTLPIVRGSDQAEFSDLDSAIASAGTTGPETFHVTGSAGGGLINKADITIRGGGPIDSLGGTTTTAIVAIQANGIVLDNLSIDGSSVVSLVPAVSLASVATLNSVDIDSSPGDGVQVSSPSSSLTVNRSNITNSAGNGINILGTATNATVTLKDSSIDTSSGRGVLGDGAPSTFSMDNVSIDNSVLDAIRYNGSGQNITITNSDFFNNGTGGERGLRLQVDNSTITMTDTKILSSPSDDQFLVRGSGTVAHVTDCLVVGTGVTGGAGLRVRNGSTLIIDSCTVENCNQAVRLRGGDTVFVSNSLLSDCATGYEDNTGGGNTVNSDGVDILNPSTAGVLVLGANVNIDLSNTQILDSAGPGVNVLVGASTPTVSLDGCTIANSGGRGILNDDNGGTFTVSNSTISNSVLDGMRINGSNHSISLNASTFSGNGTGGERGLRLQVDNSTISAIGCTFTGSPLDDNFLVRGSGTTATLTNCISSNCPEAGFRVRNGSTMNISDCTAENCNQGVRLRGGDTVNISDSVLRNCQTGLEDNTGGSNSITATNVTISNPSTAGVLVFGANTNIDLNNSSITNSSGHGIHVQLDTLNGVDATGVTVDLDGCTIDNSGGQGILNNPNGNTFIVNNSTISNSVLDGVRINGSNHVITLTNSVFNGNGTGGERGLRLQVDSSTITATGCTFSNSPSDDNFLIRGSGTVASVTNCNSFGTPGAAYRVRNGSTLNIASSTASLCDQAVRLRAGDTSTVTNSCFFNCQTGIETSDNGPGNTVTVSSVTIQGCTEGISDISLPGDANTWNVQYTIIADWNEAAGGFGFADVNGDSTITDDFNVYADSDVANSARVNVTKGTNSIDESNVSALFCSVNPADSDFLHISDPSAAYNIDGMGGNAGAKPQSCNISVVTDWSLY